MQSQPFDQPVTVYLKHSDGVIRPVPLTTTEEAYRALMLTDSLAVSDPAWHFALAAVVDALLDPAPEKVEASRRVLDRMAMYRAKSDDRPLTMH